MIQLLIMFMASGLIMGVPINKITIDANGEKRWCQDEIPDEKNLESIVHRVYHSVLDREIQRPEGLSLSEYPAFILSKFLGRAIVPPTLQNGGITAHENSAFRNFFGPGGLGSYEHSEREFKLHYSPPFGSDLRVSKALKIVTSYLLKNAYTWKIVRISHPRARQQAKSLWALSKGKESRWKTNNMFGKTITIYPTFPVHYERHKIFLEIADGATSPTRRQQLIGELVRLADLETNPEKLEEMKLEFLIKAMTDITRELQENGITQDSVLPMMDCQFFGFPGFSGRYEAVKRIYEIQILGNLEKDCMCKKDSQKFPPILLDANIICPDKKSFETRWIREDFQLPCED